MVTESNIIILGRLRVGVIAVFVALGAAMLGFFLREELWGGGFADTLFHHLLGPMTGPAAISCAIIVLYLFARMWRERDDYLYHDGVTLFRGPNRSWPLASIRDVMFTRNFLGIRSLRIDVGNGAKPPELTKAYMLVERPETVRDAIAIAVAQAGR